LCSKATARKANRAQLARDYGINREILYNFLRAARCADIDRRTTLLRVEGNGP